MKKFTKTLSIVLLIAMCMSMCTIGAFADEHVCGNDTLKYIEAKAATCTEDGWKEYYECNGCDVLRLPGGEVVTWDQIKVPAGHSIEAVAAVAPGCDTTGAEAYYKCSSCGKLFSDADATAEIAAPVEVPVAGHQLVNVAEVPATCTAAGTKAHRECTVCGNLYKAAADVLTDAAALAIPVADHDFGTDGKAKTCADCGAQNPEQPAPFAVSGDASIDYNTASTFNYMVVDPATYTLASVSAGGYNLVRGAGFSYDSYTGSIVISKAALSAIIDGKSSIELVFTATDGSSVGGFAVTNSENIVVDDLYISGLTQNKYVKESGKAVSFQTNITDPSCIKIFSGTTQMDVPTASYTFTKAYGDVYTYSFSNTFLDNLDCGYYEIRCYYGNSNSEYVTPGTLMISDPNTNVDDVLYFVNSTQGDSEYYKYVSGDEVPRMYCELFLVDGARLQVSTNGGKSWSNVNVHNYYIEPNQKGNDTSHAWIGSAYLDSLNADTIYYFRVVVPASANGTNADWVSNTVSVTTGPTLKAVDTAKHVINSTKNLKFVASEKIAKVYVGNVQLTDDEDFAISNDGKTVTLSPSFLNKRTAGSTYTIKVLTNNGEYASTTFQILTTAQASASPRTGDTSNIALWTAVLMLSAGAAVAILPRLKKEQ